jgi:alpha-beta hydrolase superfamily lysophospholipase
MRRAGFILAAVVTLWIIASWSCGYYLTRRARSPFAEPAPAVAWGRLEQLRLSTSDGQEIGAWFGAGPEDGPSVLLLHGNGDSRSTLLPLAEFFARRRCSVLPISLRAHGDSTGAVNDIGYSARRDVMAAIDYLERRRAGRPILIHGTSLGAAAAIYAAGTLGTRVFGYILESPFTDLRTAIRNRTENYLPFPLDRIGYAGMALTGPFVLPDLDRMAPLTAIGAIPTSVRVVLLAGGRDRESRPEEARAFYEQISAHSRLVWFKEAGHESCYLHDPSLYREAVSGLLAAATRATPGNSQVFHNARSQPHGRATGIKR